MAAADVVETVSERAFVLSIYKLVDEIIDVAKAGAITWQQANNLIVDAVAVASKAYEPRQELLDCICADLHFALHADGRTLN